MNTQTQKALIQFIESLSITALITALIAVSPLLTATSWNWRPVLFTFIVAFAFSLAHGIAAYLKAYNLPLATIVDADVAAIEQKIEPVTVATNTTTTTIVAPLAGKEGAV